MSSLPGERYHGRTWCSLRVGVLLCLRTRPQCRRVRAVCPRNPRKVTILRPLPILPLTALRGDPRGPCTVTESLAQKWLC